MFRWNFPSWSQGLSLSVSNTQTKPIIQLPVRQWVVRKKLLSIYKKSSHKRNPFVFQENDVSEQETLRPTTTNSVLTKDVLRKETSCPASRLCLCAVLQAASRSNGWQWQPNMPDNTDTILLNFREKYRLSGWHQIITVVSSIEPCTKVSLERSG